MSSLTLQSATKRFGAVTAVSELDLDVRDGEFFVLLGPSGAGKTTTLRLAAGLETPDEGRVLMDGQDVTHLPPAPRDVAFVFQQYSLYPHLTVFDNIAFPLRSAMRRVDAGEVKRRVERVAETLQRVAIGRALVREPRVFLMDEPLSSLDAKLREELRAELKALQRRTGATVLYVTHDQVEATTLADRIAILEEGRVRQVGTPREIYDKPGTLHVAQRLGSPAFNVLPASWFEGSVDPRTAHVGIRPEDVELAPGDGPSHFDVVECSLVKHLVVAERGGVEVRIRRVMDRAFAPGDPVRISFPLKNCLRFDADGRRLDT